MDEHEWSQSMMLFEELSQQTLIPWGGSDEDGEEEPKVDEDDVDEPDLYQDDPEDSSMSDVDDVDTIPPIAPLLFVFDEQDPLFGSDQDS